MQLKNLAQKPRRGALPREEMSTPARSVAGVEPGWVGCKNAILPTELSPFLDCNATKVHHIGFFFLIVTLTD
jgi:hypothetical protein